MLMELRRMRRKRWRQKVLAAYSTLRRHLAFVDQVRKEIFDKKVPTTVFLLNCRTS